MPMHHRHGLVHVYMVSIEVQINQSSLVGTNKCD